MKVTLSNEQYFEVIDYMMEHKFVFSYEYVTSNHVLTVIYRYVYEDLRSSKYEDLRSSKFTKGNMKEFFKLLKADDLLALRFFVHYIMKTIVIYPACCKHKEERPDR